MTSTDGPSPEASGLPDDVELLWGLRPVARRGRKPGLSVQDITRAAVAVADAEGLAAVSMSRVAAELGNATMALYRHVRSKDELLLLMSDVALESPPEPPADGDWRHQLAWWAREVLAVMRRHRWYREIPITGPPVGPRNLEWFDRGLQALEGTGLPEPDKVAVVMGVLMLVHGQARLSVDLATGYAEDPSSFGSGYGAALEHLVDPRRMPALARVIAAGVFTQPDPPADFDGLDAEFEFALDRYCDGVEAALRPSGEPSASG